MMSFSNTNLRKSYKCYNFQILQYKLITNRSYGKKHWNGKILYRRKSFDSVSVTVRFTFYLFLLLFMLKVWWKGSWLFQWNCSCSPPNAPVFYVDINIQWNRTCWRERKNRSTNKKNTVSDNVNCITYFWAFRHLILKQILQVLSATGSKSTICKWRRYSCCRSSSCQTFAGFKLNSNTLS